MPDRNSTSDYFCKPLLEKAMNSLFRRLFRSTSRSPKARAPHRSRLGLEPLEDRVVPTVVFQPNFGPEMQAPGSTYGGGGLVSPPVFEIFWGSNWTHSQDPTAYITATKALLGSAYF